MTWLLRVIGSVPPLQWISIALGVLSLSREIFKWMSEHEKTTRGKALRVHEFKRAIKKARTNNDTSDIMRRFAELGIMRDISENTLESKDL